MSCLVVSPVAGCVVVAIDLLLIVFALTSSRCRKPSTLDPRHQLLDLRLLLAGERQKRQPRRASVIAIDVHRVLHARDAEFTGHAQGGLSDTLLFFVGEGLVS